VQKLVLATGQTAVVAEGEFEARSIGSYSVRYLLDTKLRNRMMTPLSSRRASFRARDGTIEKVFLAELGNDGPPSLVVVIRSCGFRWLLVYGRIHDWQE
jgi:hypothetical protein